MGLPPTPALQVLGHNSLLVTQPSTGRLFGGDNNRAAAGVGAHSPRSPPLARPGENKVVRNAGARRPGTRGEKGTQTPGPRSERPEGSCWSPLRRGPWAPAEGLPIPAQSLAPRSRAPRWGQQPQDHPGAGGGCWKDVAGKAQSPEPQPQPQIRLTKSRASPPPGFWVLQLLPSSADQKPRPAPPRSCAAPPLAPRTWRKVPGVVASERILREEAPRFSPSAGRRGPRRPSAQAPTSC